MYQNYFSKFYGKVLWCNILDSFPSHLKKLRSILRFWLEKFNCGFFHSFHSRKNTTKQLFLTTILADFFCVCVTYWNFLLQKRNNLIPSQLQTFWHGFLREINIYIWLDFFYIEFLKNSLFFSILYPRYESLLWELEEAIMDF